MKTVTIASAFLLTFVLLAALTPDALARGRNCRPEERLPGGRCADEWAAQEEKATDETGHHDEAGAGESADVPESGRRIE